MRTLADARWRGLRDGWNQALRAIIDLLCFVTGGGRVALLLSIRGLLLGAIITRDAVEETFSRIRHSHIILLVFIHVSRLIQLVSSFRGEVLVADTVLRTF